MTKNKLRQRIYDQRSAAKKKEKHMMAKEEDFKERLKEINRSYETAQLGEIII
jgi:hypothetical protein